MGAVTFSVSVEACPCITVAVWGLELVRSIGGSSYCSYRCRRRAVEPPLQLAEFGEKCK